jgi:hypothetical protein
MEISADVVLPFPRPLVFASYRDRLAELVPHLPNVTAIEVRERQDEGAVVRLVNVWHGAGEIPRAVRAVVSDRMLSWTDRAVWYADRFTCEWTIETHAFTEAVSCRGEDRFIALDAERTRLEIRGDLVVDLAQVALVPRLLRGSLGPTVERFLVGRITPNLTRVTDALVRLLAAERAG